MRFLEEFKSYEKDNKRFFSIVNHHIYKRDFDIVKKLARNVSRITKDPELKKRTQELFMLDSRANEFFGLGETIVGSMSNMVFAGNVNLKTEDPKAQTFLNKIYFDGYFMDAIKKAYELALATSGKSYLFRNTLQEYDSYTNIKIKDEFLDYEIFPDYEIELYRNVLTRTFYKTIEVEKDKYIYKFQYVYNTQKDGSTILEIKGFDDEDVLISDSETMELLGIDTVVEAYDFIPYREINMHKGMIPNMLFIEDSLALNLYFQDVDLSSAQTHTYTPDSMLYENVFTETEMVQTFKDRYATQHVVKSGGLDEQKIVVVEGKSAISEIEKNLALNVIQGCLDAKISPVSIGYSLIDKIASNTDVGVAKERNSIRLRENHISDLKIYIAKELVELAKLENIKLTVNDIAVIFDPYITPSIETMTNVLSKQVQFGIKSRELAVRDLNKNELTDREVEEEYERIKTLGTQIDYNVEQRKQEEKGESNVLKSSGIEE